MIFTGGFILSHALIIYLRLKGSITYDKGVHNINLFSEISLLVIFLVQILSDILIISLDTTFLVCLVIVNSLAIIVINFAKNKVRAKFLAKVDIFNYTKENDALLMMVYLH